MRYVLLVFDDPEEIAALAPTARAHLDAAWLALADAFHRSGHFRSSAALEPASTATTLRTRNGKRAMTDGACSQGAEELVGYFEVEAEHLDEALALAARVPSTRHGAVEVRPLRRAS